MTHSRPRTRRILAALALCLGLSSPSWAAWTSPANMPVNYTMPPPPRRATYQPVNASVQNNTGAASVGAMRIVVDSSSTSLLNADGNTGYPYYKSYKNVSTSPSYTLGAGASSAVIEFQFTKPGKNQTLTVTFHTEVDVADSDNDGVSDALDQCPNTQVGYPVDANGCATYQRDDDGDGVIGQYDQCPNTPNGCLVNAVGCSLDSDGDLTCDGIDQCPNTPPGQPYTPNGCPWIQLDDDGDGVTNGDDQCPNTPVGETPDANGCAWSQRDDDEDGALNSWDQCPNTPSGEPVNGAGCAWTQLDDDSDGISNVADLCPGTPGGSSVGPEGCRDEDSVPFASIGVYPTIVPTTEAWEWVARADWTGFDGHTLARVELWETTSDGTPLAYVADMLDDGVGLDQSAGDGVFTYHAPAAFATEGIRYFQSRFVLSVPGGEVSAPSAPSAQLGTIFTTGAPTGSTPELEADPGNPDSPIVLGNLLDIQFASGTDEHTVQTILGSVSATVLDILVSNQNTFYTVELNAPDLAALDAARATLQTNPEVLSAGYVGIIGLAAPAPGAAFPADDIYSQDGQCSLRVSRANEVWPLNTTWPFDGKPIFVVDTGVYDIDVYPEFAPVAGTINVPVMVNGSVTWIEASGWSVSKNGKGGVYETDVNGHGTAVASVLAAAHNGNALVGAGKGFPIFSVSAWESTGTRKNMIPYTIKAVDFALEHGAKIIQLSLHNNMICNRISPELEASTCLHEQDWRDVGLKAQQKGALIINALENIPINSDSIFPGTNVGYRPVAGTGKALGRSPTSIYHSSFPLAAPAEDILHLGHGYYGHIQYDPYTTDTGNSLAAPLVSATAAMVWARNPSWNADQVWQRILDTTQPLDPALQVGQLLDIASAVQGYDFFVFAEDPVKGIRDGTLTYRIANPGTGFDGSGWTLPSSVSGTMSAVSVDTLGNVVQGPFTTGVTSAEGAITFTPTAMDAHVVVTFTGTIDGKTVELAATHEHSMTLEYSAGQNINGGIDITEVFTDHPGEFTKAPVTFTPENIVVEENVGGTWVPRAGSFSGMHWTPGGSYDTSEAQVYRVTATGIITICGDRAKRYVLARQISDPLEVNGPDVLHNGSVYTVSNGSPSYYWALDQRPPSDDPSYYLEPQIVQNPNDAFATYSLPLGLSPWCGMRHASVTVIAQTAIGATYGFKDVWLPMLQSNYVSTQSIGHEEWNCTAPGSCTGSTVTDATDPVWAANADTVIPSGSRYWWRPTDPGISFYADGVVDGIAHATHYATWCFARHCTQSATPDFSALNPDGLCQSFYDPQTNPCTDAGDHLVTEQILKVYAYDYSQAGNTGLTPQQVESTLVPPWQNCFPDFDPSCTGDINFPLQMPPGIAPCGSP